jgi:hypothetical protein
MGSAEISGNTSGRVANKGMEGLAITPEGKHLYGFMQSPLIQDGGDGGRANRIVWIDVSTGKVKQYAYDNYIPAKSKAYNSSEILAVNSKVLLVLERDGKGLGDGSNASVKQIWKVDLTNAEDVSQLSGQDALLAKAPAKSLFLDIRATLNAAGITDDQIPAKLEGMAFGQDVVVNGQTKHTLYIANDNDFLPVVNGLANPNQFFVFAFDDADLGAAPSGTSRSDQPCSSSCSISSTRALAGVSRPAEGKAPSGWPTTPPAQQRLARSTATPGTGRCAGPPAPHAASRCRCPRPPGHGPPAPPGPAPGRRRSPRGWPRCPPAATGPPAGGWPGQPCGLVRVGLGPGSQHAHLPFLHQRQRAGLVGGKGIHPVAVDLAHILGSHHPPCRHRQHPRAPGQPATVTASSRFCGPSGISAEAGRIAAVSTTGLVGASTRCRNQAVSSSVSVPCVITTPCTSSRASASATAWARPCHSPWSMSLLSIWASWRASSAWPARAGTAASRSATLTSPAR